MSILNVNQIQPVGSGQTVTISAANITASSSTITANTFSGALSSSGVSTFSDTVNVGAGKSIRLYGASSGYSEIVAAAGSASTTFTLPANGGSASQYLQTDGSGTLSWVTPTVYTQNALGTETATTSGTSVEWTGLPTWVRQIVVNFNELSTAGTADMLVQLGTATDWITSGYLSNSHNNSASVYGNSTSGFIIDTLGASEVLGGSMIITKVADDAWVEVFKGKTGNASGDAGAGTLNGSGTITRIRLNLTASSFDAGSAGIWYVG